MKSPMLEQSMGLLTAGGPRGASGYGEAESAIDTVLDRIHCRIGLGRERCCSRDRFGSGHWHRPEDRLNHLGLHTNRFDLNRLRLTEFSVYWFRLTEFVICLWIGRKEGLERSYHALDLSLSKLKAIEFPDNPVELRMCDFERRQVIFAIDL
jgi:hypothetical protein